MKCRFISLCLLALVLLSFTNAPKIRIFMIGDSTMANKVLDKGNPERGWGHVLPCFFSEDVEVFNHAVNGRSTKSFIDEGRWDKVVEQLCPGDYVIIQFGHNDEKTDEKRHTDPGTTFDANLRRFCQEAMSKGAKPVLLNSIVRRNFGQNSDAVAADDSRYEAGQGPRVNEGNKLVDTHGAYLDSPRNVATELNVPFVDANHLTHQLVEPMGPTASKALYMWLAPNEVELYPNGREDNTHLNIYGAHVVARLLLDAIVKQVEELKPYVRNYDFTVAQDGSGDYFSLKDAVKAAEVFKGIPVTIRIRKGNYQSVVLPENIKLIKDAEVSGLN